LSRYRPHLLLAVALAMIAAAFSLPPIAQEPAYHRFVDVRTLLGVPNFWNVASNLPFVIAGALGLWRYHAVRAQVREPLRSAAIALFLGVLLVGFGSGWYHLAPSNGSLVWDRLPMTVAFMALFALVLGVRIDTRLAQWLLWPLLVLGAASVVYWHVTELDGHGDLRPYALVQFLPVLLIPLVLWLYAGAGRQGDRPGPGLVRARQAARALRRAGVRRARRRDQRAQPQARRRGAGHGRPARRLAARRRTLRRCCGLSPGRCW
jgi:hypothetical protein